MDFGRPLFLLSVGFVFHVKLSFFWRNFGNKKWRRKSGLALKISVFFVSRETWADCFMADSDSTQFTSFPQRLWNL